MASERSIRYQFISFFRLKWSASIEGGDSFVFPDPLSQVTNQENIKLIKGVLVEDIRRALWFMAENKPLNKIVFSLFFKKF